MRCKIVLLVLFLILVSSSFASSLTPGSRAMGLGGAFASLGDDVWGGWWNPASILRSGRFLIGSEYSNLYPNLDSGSLHYAAFSYLQPVSEYLAFAMGMDYLNSSGLYSEGEANFTFAFRPGIFPVSIGLTGRYLFRIFADNEFTSYDPLFALNGQKGQGIGLNAGFQAEIGRTATISGVAQNIIQPDLGLGEADKEPMRFSLGAAFYPSFATPAVQIDYGLERIAGKLDLNFSAGFEKWIGSSSNWGIRSGYAFKASGLTHEGSAGFSVRTEGSIPIQLDYAFSIPMNSLYSTWGRHRIGLSFRLGGAQWNETSSRVPLPPMVDRRTWFPDTDMYKFDLWAVRDVQRDSLMVAQYEDVPLNSPVILDENQLLYGYFPVNSTIEQDVIRSLTANFKVPRFWFEQNNLEMRLLRLHQVSEEGSLERVPVAMIEEDEAFYYYETDLNEFSDCMITCRPAELVMLAPRTVYGAIDSVDILEASLEFRVNKVWMDENRIDPLTIGLSRVQGGVPLDVEIRQIDEDLEYCYYETDPINLFQFVIVATEREGLPVSKIYFDHGIDDIRADQIPSLDRIIQTLRANPGVFVSVEGHADSDGTFSFNDGLSKSRAERIADYLAANLGDVNVSIEPTWFGERRPAAANDTEEGRRLNRRVEIVILRSNQ
ncbi:MAG: PGF-pre-PGF domain-containing protein [Candidatus Aegiribacteria sp.]|nr:PGF-pre-PGF domain-containing protein [Candidatus Aegiribacteria sp.]